MGISSTLGALRRAFSEGHLFIPEKIFSEKRVAVIGAAESLLEEENGAYIDSFDVVVRVNRALLTWDPAYQTFTGKRTDVLFHSFFENDYSGGGRIDKKMLQNFDVSYLVHPHSDLKGFRTHLAFYKRKKDNFPTYLLEPTQYMRIKKQFGAWTPTVGYCALHSVLSAPCREVYISGFTFFKTRYSPGYRDHFRTEKANNEHIQKQGLHNPDLEFRLFQNLVQISKAGSIILDKKLSKLLKDSRP